MKTHQLDIVYQDGLSGLNYLCKIFDSFVSEHLPRASQIFLSLGLSTRTFASKWFLTLFACILPMEIVLRIWDVFLYEGWEFIFCVSLAILEHSLGLKKKEY